MDWAMVPAFVPGLIPALDPDFDQIEETETELCALPRRLTEDEAHRIFEALQVKYPEASVESHW
jgi:hypothetical protein